MKISELPKEYYDLGMANEDVSDLWIDPERIIGDRVDAWFDWGSSNEGYDFWDAVDYAENESELPPLPTNFEQAIRDLKEHNKEMEKLIQRLEGLK